MTAGADPSRNAGAEPDAAPAADRSRPPAATAAWDAGHAAYPAGLRDLANPPGTLFVAGALPRVPMVAIVGSRAATAYGLAIAQRLAADLGRLGVPVVSGLARGIDAAAHTGALDAGGDTVAVLPSGLDTITPATHTALARRIAAHGALVTELATGGPRHRGEFLERNRLIAALAVVTVVVEAAVESGALGTAGWARRLGRPVLAVPGDVSRATSRGCHRLLRQGALVCEDARDVLAAMTGRAAVAPAGRRGARPPSAAATGAAAAMPGAFATPTTPEARLLAVLSAVPATLDVLAARSGLAVDQTLAALVPLEWSGLAVAEPGPRWRAA